LRFLDVVREINERFVGNEVPINEEFSPLMNNSLKLFEFDELNILSGQFE
jgi:hypothetical protein